ncbi:MAG: penicillin-binding transpeptidase domain-containing protein [Pseudomonadota bacterium]
MSRVHTEKGVEWGITESILAPVITQHVAEKRFPESVSIPGLDLGGELQVTYTLDDELQHEATRLLRKHRPDYGVLVAIDPDNGHILAMSDNTRSGTNHGNLATRNTFPAASISKIITAVAALEENKANARTVIPFNGKATSLYKKNVFNHKNNKWTRKLTLTESFGKSVNSVFGRLGAVTLGGKTMREYAYRLGFDGQFASDLSFGNGSIDLDVEDRWQVAEMASGYTRRNTLSPLHAATLAATAINGGDLVAPVIVEAMTGPFGVPVYSHQQPARSEAMSESTSSQLRTLMEQTVSDGSARKSFRRFNRGDYKSVTVGGKTGSLTGHQPPGKYDWFVGYAYRGDKKIAFAALCINKEKWYVKSARLARELLEFYFSGDRDQQTPEIAAAL